MNNILSINLQAKFSAICLKLLSIPFVLSVLSLSACSTSSTEGIAQQQTPLVSVKEVMRGVIEPASNTLWAAAMDENVPKTNSDWNALEQAAIQLLTATSTMSHGGSGANDNTWASSEEWQKYNQQMAELGTQMLTLIHERKYDDMLDAGNFLVELCGDCHTAFPGDSQ